jgi:D-alanyl-D-alanine carboxypeptidase
MQTEDANSIPGSRLGRDELDAMLAGLPEAIQSGIRSNPAEFLRETAALVRSGSAPILVDKEHALAAEYVPADLVSLDAYGEQLSRSREGHRLTRGTTEALVEMTRAAREAGVDLLVSSTYRSYDYQRDLYARWVAELGQEEADRVSARPGTSQHQIGTTLDFGCICLEFATTPAGRWVAEHAHEFGFSLSYPDGYEWLTGYAYEPWHYRYIGRDASVYEQRWFDGIQQHMVEFLHDHGSTIAGAQA